MKKKIGLSILAIIVIAVIYGSIELIPIIKLLKDVDVSDFEPPVIKEVENVDKIMTENDDSEEIVDKLTTDTEEDALFSEDNSLEISNIENKASENNGNDQRTNTKKTNIQKNNKNNPKKAHEPEYSNKSSDSNDSSKSKPSSNTTDKNNQAITISSKKIENVEKEITLADKAKAVKLVVSKLSVSDIKALKELASGGLTSEEKTKAVKIAYSKYSEEELKLIKDLYNKYVGK